MIEPSPDAVAQPSLPSAEVAGRERALTLHRQTIKNDILHALIRTGIGPEATVQVLDALCQGRIPHTSVLYHQFPQVYR